MENYISREEHDEFVKRMENEHERQNHRIHLLEENVRQITELTSSVRELAINMKSMAEEQKMQNERLKELEGRDGEMWRKVTGYLVTAVVGVLVGYIFTQIGM